MGKNTVRVVARMRPTDHFAAQNILLQEDSKTIVLQSASRRSQLAGPSPSSGAGGQPEQETHSYKVDLVLKDASQETVFETCGRDMVTNVMQGINGTVMAYGQTGAGKTYTMLGGTDYRTRGLVPRMIKAVFDEASNQAERHFDIAVSFVEVYNNRIFDLLNPDAQEDFAVLEDQRGNVSIRGVESRRCTQEAEALSLLFMGDTNRSVAEHLLNSASSRSHTIFTLHVTTRSRVESESASLVGKLHCVDLAGSERLSKTQSEGAIVKEAQQINKSLSFLEQVVMALGSTNRGHIPFRQSKLTAILKDSLGGNSKTTMIANLWPEERHLEETSSTLKFAARMMRVQSDPTVNMLLDPATQVRQLQRQIVDLKAELQMQNQLYGKSHIAYDGDIGEDEKFEMEKLVKTYLAGKASDIPVRSLREVKEYFRIFKACFDQCVAEGGSRAAIVDDHASSAAPPVKGAAMPTSPVAAAVAGQKGALPVPPPAARRNSEQGVGALDMATGLSLGVAAPAKGVRELTKAASPSKSAPPAEHTPRGQSTSGGTQPLDAGGPDGTAPSLANGGGSNAAAPDRNVAFAEYRRKEGAKLAAAMKEHQDQLAIKRKAAADLSLAVNDAKMHIDSEVQQLEHRRLDRISRGEEEVVDEEEFELVKAVKQHKAEYRRLFDDLSTAKTARDHLVRLVDHAKQQLLQAFDEWFDRTFNARPKDASGKQKSTFAAMRGGGGSSSAAADDDPLDEGERFELLELQRVMEDDPDSVEYHRARKMTQAKQQLLQHAAAGAGRKAVPPGGSSSVSRRR